MLGLPDTAAPSIADLLRRDELAPVAISVDAPLDAVLDLFNAHAGLRLLAVVDADDRPMGAILDPDVRRLLLNPFSHALRQNPAYGRCIRDLIRPAPVADAMLTLAQVMDVHARSGAGEGMILTLDGILHAVIDNRRLVQLVAEKEIARARASAARGRRIETASENFERHIASLLVDMRELATMVGDHAVMTGQRSGDTGRHAAAVAAAAAQGTDNLARIEGHGEELAAALERIATSTHDARELADRAVALVADSASRTSDLVRSVQSIETVIETIGAISAKVNLLALNAGIEAARAGDAGRGFAVVAQEVKSLSHQTAAAAGQVIDYITDIRRSVAAVTDTRGAVARAISEIETRSSAIETAVDGQKSATRRIAGTIGEASQGAAAIGADAVQIAANAGQAAEAAEAMRSLADRFLTSARALTTETDGLLNAIRYA